MIELDRLRARRVELRRRLSAAAATVLGGPPDWLDRRDYAETLERELRATEPASKKHGIRQSSERLPPNH